MGFGGIGKTIAFDLISQQKPYNLNIIDCDENVKGALLDLKQANQINRSCEISYNDFDLLEKSDFIFHSAGIGVSKNHDRNSVLHENVRITKELFSSRCFKENCKIIVITNPLDSITYFTWKYSGLSKKQVIGVGTYLDTIRMNFYLNELSLKNYQSILLGEHGKAIVFISSLFTKNKERVPSSEIDSSLIAHCLDQTLNAAHEIKQYGDASILGVALCALDIFNHLQSKEGTILPVCTVLNDQFASKLEVKECAMSLYSSVNKEGAIQQFPLELTEIEQEKLKEAAAKIALTIQSAKSIDEHQS
ncbi:MAG: hypothetical protein ABJG68_17225 [Crocinitomicaceae bacterium]